MTTKRKNQSNTKTEVTPFDPPSLFNIQYPNSRTGMFSLRAPFKDSYNTNQSQQELFTRNVTPEVIHPEYLHQDQNRQGPPPPPPFFDYPSTRRDAEVQCSLIDRSDSRDGLLVRRRQGFVTDRTNYGYLSPRYRVQLNLQPVQPNIYEVWNVDTPPPRSLPINEPIRRREPSIRVRSSRLVSIKSLSDDDESDYDEYLLYTYDSPRPYFTAPVRMVHVRQNASTICY